MESSNELVDPNAPVLPKKKRGQQPGRPAPKRRDYSHLPVREEVLDVPEESKVCGCCGLPMESIGHSDEHEQIEIETIWLRWMVGVVRFFLDWLGRIYVAREVIDDVRDGTRQEAEIVVRFWKRDGQFDTWVCKVDGSNVRVYQR